MGNAAAKRTRAKRTCFRMMRKKPQLLAVIAHAAVTPGVDWTGDTDGDRDAQHQALTTAVQQHGGGVVRKNDEGARVDYLAGEIEIIRAAIDEAAASGGEVDFTALTKALKDSKCTRYERTRPSVRSKVENLRKRQMKGAATRKRRGQKIRVDTGAPSQKKKKSA